jgi:hypothetical protein
MLGEPLLKISVPKIYVLQQVTICGIYQVTS